MLVDRLAVDRKCDRNIFGVSHKEDAPRKPRKHGAVASKCGISDEQICIMTGARCGGAVYAETVSRTHPSSEEIKLVFMYPEQ